MPGSTVSPIEESDRTVVVDLFNYYIEHTDAAFPEKAVPYEVFDILMQIARGYPTVAVRMLHLAVLCPVQSGLLYAGAG